MPLLEKDLIKNLNSGSFILFCGAGASVDAGYPTWHTMCELVIDEYGRKYASDSNSNKLLKKYLDQSEYLDLFDFIEKKTSKDELVKILEDIFARITPSESELNSTLLQWPFNIYITTK